ncbi:ABA-responsive protein ABR17-like [Lathyrus oleraceus]|uniref:ABA-responsive protein ABR17-like n=1 Tax=Pisum sativum TaxID=3888 RepID=UPI0021CF47D0|nr:ABA-responsive protein ABR17-like [Pisum sativum]
MNCQQLHQEEFCLLLMFIGEDMNLCGKTNYVLHKLEAEDEANLIYNYSLVGGTGLDESLEKITSETKVVPGTDGGSIVKLSLKYHTKGDAALSDAIPDESKIKGTGLFKAIGGYVLANPDY